MIQQKMAANPKGLKVTKNEVSQEFDLKEITGVDLSNKKRLVRAIQQDIIDYTLKRAGEGKGIGGTTLKTPYSESYANSPAFKAAGKDKNKVNMRLVGDMLGSLDVISENGAKFKIGFVDEEENVKAFAHMTGFEGHPHISGPKRKFFGLTQKELSDILSDYSDEIEKLKQTKKEPQSEQTTQVIRQQEQTASEFEQFLGRVLRITDIVDVTED
jgi:hypothetical protein